MTFLAALRCDGIEALWLLDGPINGERFRIYVEKVLVPTLRPSDMMVIGDIILISTRAPFVALSSLVN